MTTADSTSHQTPTPTSQVSIKTLRQVTFAGFAGTVVEWFDFAVYGFTATHHRHRVLSLIPTVL